MTTITNNKLTDETLKAWKTEAMISLGETAKDCRDYSHHEAILALVTELQERRKADNQEPAGYHVIKECGKIGCSVATLEEAEKTRDFWNKKWTIRPYFYSAPPVQETGVYKDMLDIIGLLENNEWAEHCTSTVLGSFLESEITRLVGKEQPAPVVPEEKRDDDGNTTSEFEHGWNACRTAMLQGSQPVSNRDELPYAQVKAVADLYALCWQSGEVVTYTPDPEKATIWLNNYSGTCAQEYVKLERLQEALAGNSPVTPDGWISRFEEMPDPSSEKRVCAFTPTNHEDMRYRFVPASLFKTVCRDATHWFYMLPPVGREEVAGG
ncbi:TPA: DUF551 domain-containing protein [Salmonella enterica]